VIPFEGTYLKKMAFLEAMMASAFWGFGFTATIWSLQAFTLSQILFLRFLFVGLLGLGWALIQRRLNLKKFLSFTFVPALFLVLELVFQIWGMQYTFATNAGFLTVTYILMVPLLEKILWRRSIPRSHWLWVTLALIGVLVMLGPQDLGMRWGDGLMLISALGASLHMISIDHLGKSENNLFFTNTMQSLWGAVFLLPVILLKHEPWVWSFALKPWLGLASLTFGSTLLAFYFQMRAQRTLSPSISSLLFLVESPISAAFGFLLLGEHMKPLQWAGCGLILVAAAGATIRSFGKSKRPNSPPSSASQI